MRNALALTKRILQQFAHDPRTVVMFILAPILVLWLFSVMLNSPAYKPTLAGVDLPSSLVQALQDQDATYQDASAADAQQMLADRSIDAILTLDGTTLNVQVEGSEATKSAAVAQTVQAAVKDVTLSQSTQLQADIQNRLDSAKSSLQSLQDNLASLASLPDLPPALAQSLSTLPTALPDFDNISTDFTPTVQDVQISYLHGSADWGSFDYFGPVFIGIFIFVFVFITSGMSLVTERTGGTMERLIVTPIRSWQLVLGFCLGFGLVSLVQAGIVLWACIALIGFPSEGSLVLVVATTFSMALVSLTLGLLVSALARTPFQVIQFMLILVVPQILLSGIFDLSSAPAWLQVLSVCFPVTHGAEALRDIMLRGAGFSDVALNFGILWAFIAAFFALACVSFARRKSH